MKQLFTGTIAVARYLTLAGFITANALNGGAAEPDAIALWPKGAVGSETRINEPEKVDRGEGKCNVTNVHQPSITPYLGCDPRNALMTVLNWSS